MKKPSDPILSAPDAVFARRLALLSGAAFRPALARGLHGIEKESLRVEPRGALALTPHPAALGAALTHPQITTDYSESLLELITQPAADAATALHELDTVHRFVYSVLGDELLWTQSMPCALPPEEDIPIAEYGTSHLGRFKHVYRRGLALRYGRAMQCIAGIHYNFSLDEAVWDALRADEHSSRSAADYRSDRYLGLMRNFRRYSWLLLYLFGASPTLHASFAGSRATGLRALGTDTLYLPYATSLRMSDLGYQNNAAQGALAPALDSLDGYLKSLAMAVSQPYPAYTALGTHRNGEWVQLNDNVLQIENELYATIRPKRVALAGERPLQALASRGVQYIEARCLDIDPFEPSGLGEPMARFLDLFLTFCALADSPALDAAQYASANANFARVAREGRQPGLRLDDGGTGQVSLLDLANALLDRIAPLAASFDAERGASAYALALDAQRAKLSDPALTPSARVLDAMREPGMNFMRFGLQQSERNAAYFRSRPLDADTQAAFVARAQQSIEAQRELERGDQGDGAFELFVADYQAALPPPSGHSAGSGA